MLIDSNESDELINFIIQELITVYRWRDFGFNERA